MMHVGPATSAAPASRVLLPASNSGNQLLDIISPPGSGFTKSGGVAGSNSKENAIPNSFSNSKLRAALGEIKPAGPGYISKSSSNTDLDGDDSRSSWRSWKRGDGLQTWELEIVNQPDVRRKANVAQLYFLNYYFDNLRYLSARKARTNAFKNMVQEAGSALTERQVESEQSSYFGRERALLRKRRTKLRVAQFHIITQVGQGGYGEVFLARKNETGEVCALKKLKKKVLIKMDEVHHVLIERDILTATRTPWLVKLLYSFQDREHVYLAMEYVPGGDFRTLLNNSGVLREEHARFYMAEMFVSVNELHKLGYIHRDLKPENFLVDASGHIKLTDFGLAAGALNPGRIESLKGRLDQVKDTDFIYRTPAERGSLYKMMRAQNVQHADSIVGSPDYMAPEVLRGRNYGVSVDYWSLGCILFEFLCGFPPFSGKTPDETWANLKNWHRVLQRPVYEKAEDLQFNLTDIAWDSIVRLIDTQDRRYASLSQVSSHPFFASLNFTNLRGMNPPFVPQLESEVDTGYFDDFENPEDMAKYKEVKDKQRNVEKVREKDEGPGARQKDRGLWMGFTFGKNGMGGNAATPAANRDMDAIDAFATMF